MSTNLEIGKLYRGRDGDAWIIERESSDAGMPMYFGKRCMNGEHLHGFRPDGTSVDHPGSMFDLVGEELDLYKILKGKEYDAFDSANYLKWEREVIKPKLEELGYTVKDFYDIESDSFGPLVRGISCTKDGLDYVISYG